MKPNVTTPMIVLVMTAAFSGQALAQDDYCDRAAEFVFKACQQEARADGSIAATVCLNIDDKDERTDCYNERGEERAEALEECDDQYDARLDLCGALGQARYAPDWDPANFVDPRDIGGSVVANPYLPMIEGMVRVYEKVFEEDGEEVEEVIIVTITDEIKHIDGVDCRTVNDVVMVDGELVEDTDDWFAQDVEGNVWYCGEEAKDYEYFDGDDPELPELVSIDGSFKAGVDGAQAGILMLADPQVGDVYREEVSWNNAEDASEIVEIDASASVPAAQCNGDCVVARAFTPIEPGVDELKYYAPGIGPILEVDEEGFRTELVELVNP